MKKFIFSISEGIQVVIEATNLTEAQKEYEKVKEEASHIKVKTIKVPSKRPTKKGLYEHLLELKEEGFFLEPKTVREIKDKLAELAIHKPLTSFPPYLNSLIKEKVLKRTKQNKDGKEIWTYENGS